MCYAEWKIGIKMWKKKDRNNNPAFYEKHVTIYYLVEITSVRVRSYDNHEPATPANKNQDNFLWKEKLLSILVEMNYGFFEKMWNFVIIWN